MQGRREVDSLVGQGQHLSQAKRGLGLRIQAWTDDGQLLGSETEQGNGTETGKRISARSEHTASPKLSCGIEHDNQKPELLCASSSTHESNH